MPQNAVVRARIDEKTKKQAARILGRMGLTVSDAMRITLKRIAREKQFDVPFLPNKETIEALVELDRGGGKSFATVDELMADLNAPD